LIKNDKLFKSLGIDEASRKAVEKMDRNSDAYTIIQSYLIGVNQFIDEGPTPIEFSLAGVDKENYTVHDVYNIIGYMAFSFAMAHKTDPLLSLLKEKLGNDYIKDLNLNVDPNTVLIKNSKMKLEGLETMVSTINHIMEITPIPPFIGSNSWVIAPQKTKSGAVLFTNDPHIGYSQPAVWFEAHVITPEHEMYGYHLAGVPFPFLGHNRDYAYGLTMFENDDIDFYKETTDPNNKDQYLSLEGPKKYEYSEKVIKVKDSADVNFILRSTQHGPIMNDAIDDLNVEDPIAMSWIYTKLSNRVIDAIYNISRARTMEDVKYGASLIHAPGLNVMYGDTKGNIAWWASAALYRLKENTNSKFILNGTSGEDEIYEYIPFTENPMAENPEWNYVYSANNQPDSIVGMLYPGYYLPEDRARRIVELLEPKNDWTKEDAAVMINDVTSSVSIDVIKHFTDEMNYNSFDNNEKKAIDILQTWDGSNSLDKVAPTVYNKWIYFYLKNTFEDEMETPLFEKFMKTHLLKREVASQISKDNSIWWDDVSTSDRIETRREILSRSLKDAVSNLEDLLGTTISEWTWDRVISLEHPHALGKVESLRSFFNVGPFPVKGAREVIDNKGYFLNGTDKFEVYSGPSTRRIIDFSDVENSLSILPTGQSGNPFSIYYEDQAKMYARGEFRKMKMNKEEIEKVSTLLVFKPRN
jgi:penicillin amidase